MKKLTTYQSVFSYEEVKLPLATLAKMPPERCTLDIRQATPQDAPTFVVYYNETEGEGQ